MRYCLTCRRLTSSGPICSQCGRSFGGNLCDAGHLNPPGARFCAQCGSTKLLQAANSISFTWVPRLLVLAGLVWLGYKEWPTLHSLQWGEKLQHQCFVVFDWLLGKILVFGFLLFLCWMFGDLCSPRIRRSIERVIKSIFVFAFRIVEVVLTGLLRILTRALGGKVGK